MQGRGLLLNISMWALRRMLVGVAGLAAWGLVMTGAAHAGGYVCETDWIRYTSCASGYYISNCPSSSSSWTGQQISSSQLTNDNSCRSCPSGFECAGGLYCPEPVAVTTVTITYNLNGGSGTAPASTTCNVGQSCTLASGNTTSFYRAGYVFKGWATSSSATTGTTTITPTANDTLYAVWSACTGYQYKTSSATAAATCTTTLSGYYATGCGSNGRACTGQSQCNGAEYCESGQRKDCPTAPSGWTRGIGRGWTNWDQCYAYRNAIDISEYCASGRLRRDASSASEYSSTVEEEQTFNAVRDAYLDGDGATLTCIECPEDTFSEGGTVRECTSVPCDHWELVDLIHLWEENVTNNEKLYELKNTYQIYAGCSALYELFLALRDYGIDWDTEYGFGDVNMGNLSREQAAEFCYHTMGFNSCRADLCPYHPGCDGNWQDAFVACMYAVAGHEAYEDQIPEILQLQLENGDLMEDDARFVYCTGEGSGESEFWGTLDYDQECSSMQLLNCQRVETVMHTLARIGRDLETKGKDPNLLYSQGNTTLVEILTDEMCALDRHYDSFMGLFGIQDECYETISNIVNQYFSCWRDNFDSSMMYEVVDVARLTNPQYAQEILHPIITTCVGNYGVSFCRANVCSPRLCGAYGTDTIPTWGSYMCIDCPVDATDVSWDLSDEFPEQKVFVDECAYRTTYASFEDDTGYYERSEVSCPYELDFWYRYGSW